MKENIYKGKYVSIKYFEDGYPKAYDGKLENITFSSSEGAYKLELKKYYDINNHGKYSLLNSKNIFTLSIPRELYRGIKTRSKKELDMEYSKINKQIDLSKNKAKSSKNSEINNFYKHTNIGFKKIILH